LRAAKRENAAAYGSKLGINLALARLSKRFNSRSWVKAAAAKFFKKAFQHSGGRARAVYEKDEGRLLLEVWLLRRQGLRAVLPLVQSARSADAEVPAAKIAAA
jgi:hypothetical protein